MVRRSKPVITRVWRSWFGDGGSDRGAENSFPGGKMNFFAIGFIEAFCICESINEKATYQTWPFFFIVVDVT